MKIREHIFICLLLLTLFSASFRCNRQPDIEVNIDAKDDATKANDHDYEYHIYYDDGTYDFDEDEMDSPSKDQEEGLCTLVNNTNGDILERNQEALDKMEKYMEIYVIANCLRDYAVHIKAQLNATKVVLAREPDRAVDSALRDHLDIDDLTHLYKTLVALPDDYPALWNGTEWKTFVIFQLDNVKDYITEHFQYFKEELPRLQTTRQFYKQRNRYVKMGEAAGLMTIFYHWFESRVCKPRMFDEAQIREQLKDHLKLVIDLPEYVQPGDKPKEETKPEPSTKPEGEKQKEEQNPKPNVAVKVQDSVNSNVNVNLATRKKDAAEENTEDGNKAGAEANTEQSQTETPTKSDGKETTGGSDREEETTGTADKADAADSSEADDKNEEKGASGEASAEETTGAADNEETTGAADKDGTTAEPDKAAVADSSKDGNKNEEKGASGEASAEETTGTAHKDETTGEPDKAAASDSSETGDRSEEKGASGEAGAEETTGAAEKEETTGEADKVHTTDSSEPDDSEESVSDKANTAEIGSVTGETTGANGEDSTESAGADTTTGGSGDAETAAPGADEATTAQDDAGVSTIRSVETS